MNNSNYQKGILNKLKINSDISYQEILNILDAFQIASGQTFAIDSTKGILDYIINHGNVCIYNTPNNGYIYIKTSGDLVELYKSIDPSIDISLDADFLEYFTR